MRTKLSAPIPARLALPADLRALRIVATPNRPVARFGQLRAGSAPQVPLRRANLHRTRSWLVYAPSGMVRRGGLTCDIE